MENNVEKKDSIDKAIIKTHLTHYLNGVGITLFVAFLVILVTEIAFLFLLKFTGVKYYLLPNNFPDLSVEVYLKEQAVHDGIVLFLFLIYFLIYRKVNYRWKEYFACTLSFVVTTILCFGHWNCPYLSLLYVVPVVVSSPLGKRVNIITTLVSICMTIVYFFVQNYFIDEYYFKSVVLIISILFIIVFYFISSLLHKNAIRAYEDIEEYISLSRELYSELSHDSTTGAFSKTALEKDLEELNKYKSIAFFDIDDFKSVNDKMGHEIGDSTLKLLVVCVRALNERVYRFGGDEFIILSKNSVQELAEKMNLVNRRFNKTTKELYSFHSSISVGISGVKEGAKGSDMIKICDRLMYKSKKSGKNRVTVEKN